ncbi:hypothetical protein GQX74_015614 [Glossina fuscipes]|nr:hypothetical protein GQX74_015614 [Glossina fuscipes]
MCLQEQNFIKLCETDEILTLHDAFKKSLRNNGNEKEPNNTNTEFGIAMMRKIASSRTACSTPVLKKTKFLQFVKRTHVNLNEKDVAREIRRDSTFSKLRNVIAEGAVNELSYKGTRNVELADGQEVFVRDFGRSNKSKWVETTIKQYLGPKSYCCILSHNNNEEKRHINQILNNRNKKVCYSLENMQNITFDCCACSESSYNNDNTTITPSHGNVETKTRRILRPKIQYKSTKILDRIFLQLKYNLNFRGKE